MPGLMLNQGTDLLLQFSMDRDISKAVQQHGEDAVQAIQRGFNHMIEAIPDMIRDTFRKEGQAGGMKKWQRIPFKWFMKRVTAPKGAQIAAQRSAYAQHKPLIDTGRLMNSIQVMHNEADRAIMTLDSQPETQAAIGTPIKEAAVHHFGGVENGIRIRSRPFMFIPQDRIPELRKRFLEAVS